MTGGRDGGWRGKGCKGGKGAWVWVAGAELKEGCEPGQRGAGGLRCFAELHEFTRKGIATMGPSVRWTRARNVCVVDWGKVGYLVALFTAEGSRCCCRQGVHGWLVLKVPVKYKGELHPCCGCMAARRTSYGYRYHPVRCH